MIYLQIVDDRTEQPSYIKKCMESLKDKIHSNEYKVITIPYNPNDQISMVRESDKIRFEFACNTDMCYVDTDCFISYLPKLENNIPYFGKCGFVKEEIPDIFYFYNNGNTEYFKNNFTPDKFSKEYSIHLNSLKELKDFKFIPDLSYFHQYTTTKYIVDMQKMKESNIHITKKYLALKKHIELMCLTIKD